MESPTGTFYNVNVPSGPVRAAAIGDPDAGAPHCSQETPGEKGATGELGT
jgi:hypothetical protein